MTNKYSPVCNSNPSLAENAIEIDIYGMTSPRMKAVWDYLEGAAYLYWSPDNRFICTDETLDFDAPRWEGESLEGFLKWLDGQHDEIFKEDDYAENNL